MAEEPGRSSRAQRSAMARISRSRCAASRTRRSRSRRWRSAMVIAPVMDSPVSRASSPASWQVSGFLMLSPMVSHGTNARASAASGGGCSMRGRRGWAGGGPGAQRARSELRGRSAGPAMGRFQGRRTRASLPYASSLQCNGGVRGGRDLRGNRISVVDAESFAGLSGMAELRRTEVLGESGDDRTSALTLQAGGGGAAAGSVSADVPALCRCPWQHAIGSRKPARSRLRTA